jgi:hypothetical protein
MAKRNKNGIKINRATNLSVIYKFIYKLFKKCGILTFFKSNYYGLIHWIYAIFIAIIILVNNNICHLLVVLFIISLNALAIVICHQCPITMLEKKHTGTSLTDNKIRFYKNLGVSYKCTHSFEQELEVVINVWAVIAVKCLLLVLLQTFNVKPLVQSVII